MGLTVHYSFESKNSQDEVISRLDHLTKAARAFGFVEVSPVYQMPTDFQKLSNDDPRRWGAIQYQKYIRYGKKCPHHRNGKMEGGNCSCGYDENPLGGWFISVYPGEGCEEMNIGLCKYPSTKEGHWEGKSFCKTQYATDFISCHLKVISLLDEAKEIGILKSVDDEGKYWETRDLNILVSELQAYDDSVRSISDMLQKAGWQGTQIQTTLDKVKRGLSFSRKGI